MEKQEEREKDEKGKYQNDFINQRLTWLGTFSSLLFVANGFGKYPVLIPMLGFGIAMSIWAGTSAANIALDQLGRNVIGAGHLCQARSFRRCSGRPGWPSSSFIFVNNTARAGCPHHLPRGFGFGGTCCGGRGEGPVPSTNSSGTVEERRFSAASKSA